MRARARALALAGSAVARSQIRDAAGGGQFYCVETGKHFLDQHALDSHKKSREFKRRRVSARARGGRQKGARATLRRRFSLSWRRVKVLKEEAKYTQAEAEWGAGKTAEILPPAHGAVAGGAAMS